MADFRLAQMRVPQDFHRDSGVRVPKDAGQGRAADAPGRRFAMPRVSLSMRDQGRSGSSGTFRGPGCSNSNKQPSLSVSRAARSTDASFEGPTSSENRQVEQRR